MIKKIWIISIIFLYFASVIIGVFFITQKSKETKLKLKTAVGSEKIGVVQIYGPIRLGYSSGPFEYDSDRIIKRLKQFQKDPQVKAVILRINSPGGSVGAVQEIYTEINRLKAQDKKIVASMGDICASGGYYVACAADKIIANPGTLTGSIGVIIQLGNFSELFRKIGIKIETIKSGLYKDIGDYSRQMTPEERTILQNLINDAYEQFVGAIKLGRNFTDQKVKEIATGSIFTGNQAKALGLVDSLGNLEDAIQVAKEISQIKGEPKIIGDYEPWERVFDYLGMFEKKNNILPEQKMRFEYMME